MLPNNGQHLTDRELLLLAYEKIDQVSRDVEAVPHIAKGLAILETKVDERTSKQAKNAAGISGIVAAITVGVLEFLRKAAQS